MRNVRGNLEEQGQGTTATGRVCTVTDQTLVGPSWTGSRIGIH